MPKKTPQLPDSSRTHSPAPTSSQAPEPLETAVPLAQQDLLRLIYDDPAAPSAGVDTSRLAFGKAAQHSDSPMPEREVHSYEWTRANYHNFVDHITEIETGRAHGLESALQSQDLRDYVLKQLIGLSGHPDPKIATKALDMLARSKYVGLYEEKRVKAADEMSASEVADAIQRLLGK
jgi:hypothetical protein